MARTGCAFAAVTCLCGPARTHRDRQVLPAYGLQDLPIKIQNPSRGSKPNTMWLPITLGESLRRGHFYLAETRTFLLCVDTEFAGRVVTLFEKKCALSAPKNAGRRVLYKTVLVVGDWSCRGRPFLGRAAVRSFQNKTESLPPGTPRIYLRGLSLRS